MFASRHAFVSSTELQRDSRARDATACRCAASRRRAMLRLALPPLSCCWTLLALPATAADPTEEEPDDVIVVHATDPDTEDTHARTTLDAAELERRAGDDLAQVLGSVPGVRQAGGTGDTSKPIVRGHTERRLLVLYDGVRHESQKWGPDHATEVDPASAGTISVVRGAAGARYGPDAIGGVILVEPPPLRTDPGVGGSVVGAFHSNGRRPFGAFRLDAVPRGAPDLSLRVEGNLAVGANLHAPEYILGNTASRTGNLGATVGYRWNSGQLRASWHHHTLQAGVFYGVSNSTPSEFNEQLGRERPPSADAWTTTYNIDRPYQLVHHDIGLLSADLFGGWGTLALTYAFQINRRQEFESVRENVSGAQYNFTLRTHSLDLLYRHPGQRLGTARLEGGVGLQASFQENVYRGYSLLPNYRSFGGGLFAYERLSFPRLDVEVGTRVDALSRVAYMSDDDFAKHVRRGTLDDQTCTETEANARCPAAYDTGSVSVGTVVHAIPDLLDAKLDLSSASRFPNVDELYLVGNAPSFPVYALGHPSLRSETAWGATLTLGLRHDAVEAELSAYAQHIDDYIYFAPDVNDAGEPQFDVTIRGTWPRFTYTPIDAALSGLDASVNLAPRAAVGLVARGATVRATERATGHQLVGTPADHLYLALVGRPPAFGPFESSEVRLATDLVAQQTRVDPDRDFAPAPEAYALLGLSAEAVFRGRNRVRLGVDAHNLLDTAYREYTSLLRYYADQPGRDIRVRIGADF